MHQLKTFLRLTLADKSAFFRAWFYLFAAKLGITCLGLNRTLALLAPRSSSPPRQAPCCRLEWPRAVLWINVAARYIPGGAKCLPTSIALLALLRRAGVESELRVGIGKITPALEAHAWVEVDGIPSNDTDDVAQRYSAFESSIATV